TAIAGGFRHTLSWRGRGGSAPRHEVTNTEEAEMRNRSRIGRRLVTAVAFSAVVVVIGAMAVAKTGGVNVTRKLTATGHAPRARGLAKLRLKSGSSGTFSVRAKHLPGGQTFDVVVNKVKVGTLTTSPRGSGTAKVSTAPHGRAAMLGVAAQRATVQ